MFRRTSSPASPALAESAPNAAHDCSLDRSFHSLMPPLGYWLLLGASILLALLPFRWVWRHRGERRAGEHEGATDGMLLLFALLLGAGAVLLACVSLARLPRDERARTGGHAVCAVVQRCAVARQRATLRQGGWVHTLSCTVAWRHQDAVRRADVAAGYPARRGALDRWVRAHPPGTVIELRAGVEEDGSLAGFAQQVPSATTTAAGAARQSLLFALVSALLFGLSRWVVLARRARRPPGGRDA